MALGKRCYRTEDLASEVSADFDDVLVALHGKAAKWQAIGIALKLSADDLDIIKADSSGVEQCLIGALRKWHQRAHPRPTWRAVIEALKTSLVGEMALAKRLEERFAPRDAPLESGISTCMLITK